MTGYVEQPHLIFQEGCVKAMQDVPGFWKSSLTEIEQVVEGVKRGNSRVLSDSAGKRAILSVEYGNKQDLKRKANYNSACGAGNPSFYADKSGGIKPVLLFIGGIHGGEFEGIVGILNLIRVLETGEDYRGKRWDFITENQDRVRLVLVPCANPDGRARIPFDSFVGRSLEELRYFVQGTWKDGSLCNWPDCKAVHPIADHVNVLGGYYNDRGINLMHDNFFLPMAEETKCLLEIADLEAPDFTVLLHGGDNCTNLLLPTHYVPQYVKEQIGKFDEKLLARSRERALRYMISEKPLADGVSYPAPSFNLTSAIHHVCGGISVVYESNMGLDHGSNIYSYEEILDSHLTLFEEAIRFCLSEDC